MYDTGRRCVSKEHSFQHSGFDFRATLFNTPLIMPWINPATKRRLPQTPTAVLVSAEAHVRMRIHRHSLPVYVHFVCLCHGLWFSCSLWNAVMCDAALWAVMNNWEINWLWPKLRFQKSSWTSAFSKAQQLHRYQISIPNLHTHLNIHTHIWSNINSHASHAAHLRGQ